MTPPVARDSNYTTQETEQPHRSPLASEEGSEGAAWSTSRAHNGSTQSFSSKLILAFALTAVMTAALLVVVLSVVWEGQFQSYTRENMKRTADNTALLLGRTYEEAGGWGQETLDTAQAASSQVSDVGIQLVSSKGIILYDDTWPAGGNFGDGEVEPSVSLAPAQAGSVVSAPVMANGSQVGTVRVWALGSDALFTKSDTVFRKNSYGAIVAAACAAIPLACIMGVFISRSLTRPIKRISNTAKAISNGDLTARTGVTGDDDLGQLGETFDDMANTMERDFKMEHRLTSDVAHELRTPLMAMLVNVEAMQDGVLPADDEHLGLVASEVRRLSRLVDAMLRLSRIENGTTAVKLEPTDVGQLVHGLVESQEGLFKDQDLTLTYEQRASSQELTIAADPDMLKQAVINLMSNAMRYTPEGGHVFVQVGREGQDITISVADTGIGIAEEDLSRVFSRFWRSDASRERVSGGLGVGLSLVKEIVSKHNGFIEVKSELGRGSVFTVHLPAEQPRNSRTRSSKE